MFGTQATNGKGVHGDPVEPVIRLSGSSSDLLIIWHSFITTDKTATMLLRVDKDEPAEES